MILLAIGFWAFIILSVLGLILTAIDIAMGKTSHHNNLPGPIRDALGEQELGKTYNVHIDITTVKKTDSPEDSSQK